jgi:hypothetical protein
LAFSTVHVLGTTRSSSVSTWSRGDFLFGGRGGENHDCIRLRTQPRVPDDFILQFFQVWVDRLIGYASVLSKY